MPARKYHKMKDGSEKAKVQATEYMTAEQIRDTTRYAKTHGMTFAAYLDACLRYGMENLPLELGEGEEEEKSPCHPNNPKPPTYRTPPNRAVTGLSKSFQETVLTTILTTSNGQR